MNPEDFFKTIEEKGALTKERVLNRFVEKIILKHFPDLTDTKKLKDILWDDDIPQEHKQQAIRDISDGLLAETHFFNESAEIGALFKKGTRHEVVKEFLWALDIGCSAMIFPVYKSGNWIAHAFGMSPEAIKKPRIIIPGDGVSITMQELSIFREEYK